MRACDGNGGFIEERNYHTDLLWNYKNFQRLAALPRCHHRLGTLPRCPLSRRGLSPPARLAVPWCAAAWLCPPNVLGASRDTGTAGGWRQRSPGLHSRGTGTPLHSAPVAPWVCQCHSKARVRDQVLPLLPQPLHHPCPVSLMFPRRGGLAAFARSRAPRTVAAVAVKGFQPQQ